MPFRPPCRFVSIISIHKRWIKTQKSRDYEKKFPPSSRSFRWKFSNLIGLRINVSQTTNLRMYQRVSISRNFARNAGGMKEKGSSQTAIYSVLSEFNLNAAGASRGRTFAKTRTNNRNKARACENTENEISRNAEEEVGEKSLKNPCRRRVSERESFAVSSCVSISVETPPRCLMLLLKVYSNM